MFISISFTKYRDEEKTRKAIEYSPKKLFVISALCLVPFFLFVLNSIGGYDIINLALFSESYRQGGFSGSGLYTGWSTLLLPLIVLVILLSNGFSKNLVLPILICFFVASILGLRIYLWGIYMATFLIIFKNMSARKILIGCFLITLFIFYKTYLYGDESISMANMAINQVTRPDLHAITSGQLLADNPLGYIEYLPFFRHYFGHDYAAFKNIYVNTIPNVQTLMPYISLNSGVAIPAYVLFFNFFAIGAIPINAACIALIFFFYRSVLTCRTLFVKLIFAYLFQVFSSALLEDVNIFYKLEEAVLIIPVAYMLMRIIVNSKKLHNNHMHHEIRNIQLQG
jgi:hypothetical protein